MTPAREASSEAVSDSLYVLAETSLDNVLAAVDRLKPALMIVDSIQTAYLEDVASSPGLGIFMRRW